MELRVNLIVLSFMELRVNLIVFPAFFSLIPVTSLILSSYLHFARLRLTSKRWDFQTHWKSSLCSNCSSPSQPVPHELFAITVQALGFPSAIILWQTWINLSLRFSLG